MFRATNQTRPQRVLADDADLAALLNELAYPGSIPADELPPELPYTRAGQHVVDANRSISPSMPRVPNNTESEGSAISGAGVARPSRGSFVMRSNPQATPALRMSGTFSPVNPSPVEAHRPVSPRAQKANTGTIIAARRASSVRLT